MPHRRIITPALLLSISATAFAAEHVAKSPWSLEIETGVGYDSNAYLAPSEPYIDYAPATPVAVNPVTKSGIFIPVNLNTEYSGRDSNQWGAIAAYSFSGSYYPEANTENANEYNHLLKGGIEFLLSQEGKREDTVQVTPYFGVHSKTYFNRDTGDQMVSNAGTDLSDRYSYNISGVSAKFDQETVRFPYNLHVDVARLDYIEPGSTAFDSYDHDYLLMGGDIDFPLAKPTKLTVSYDHYTRSYDEWRARDLSGNYVAGTARKYVYNKYGASIRQKLNNDFVVYLDYYITDRKDEYVGYYDYIKSSYGLRAIYDKDKLRIKAKALWWQRDYDNAFAFDDPSQADMSYKSAEYSIKGDYDLTKHHGLWTELKSIDQQSTDQRYEYNRYRAMVGWRWEK
ncbi:MAG TPA: hypothetical protein VGE50_01895 [Gammaproteobacteria bacterium]